jgi:hypothetical protein
MSFVAFSITQTGICSSRMQNEGIITTSSSAVVGNSNAKTGSSRGDDTSDSSEDESDLVRFEVEKDSSEQVENIETVGKPTTTTKTTTAPHNSNFVPFYTGRILTEFEYEVIHQLISKDLPTMLPSAVRSLKFIKTFHRKVLDVTYRKELALTGRMTQLRRVIMACVVRQVIANEEIPLTAYEELAKMSFFHDKELMPKTVSEVNSLRRFQRAIQTIYDIGLPPFNNKQNYMEVAAMLDGSNRFYAMGGAPSKATIRRTIIFHTVTGFEKKRKVKDDENDEEEGEGEEEGGGDSEGDENGKRKKKQSKKLQKSKDNLEKVDSGSKAKRSKPLKKVDKEIEKSSDGNHDVDNEWEHDLIQFDTTFSEFEQPPPFEASIVTDESLSVPLTDSTVKETVELNGGTSITSDHGAKGWKKRLRNQKR